MSYVAELMTAASTRWAEREALVHHGMRLTFKELHTRVTSLAQRLAAGHGTAAVLSHNQPDAVIHLACHLLGRPVAHIARDAPLPVQEKFLRQCQATELHFDPREAQRAQVLTTKVPAARAVPMAMHTGVDESAGGVCRPRPLREPAAASQVCTLLCTGGSTGMPKGVVHTHALYASLIGPLGAPMAEEEAQRALAFGDMSHLSWYAALPALLSGGTLVLHEGFDADAFLHMVPQEGITHLTLTPPQLSKVLDHPGVDHADLTGLRRVTYGAAPCAPRRVRQALERFGPLLQQAYALTESGLITLLPPEDHVRDETGILSSVGRPVPGISVEIRKSGEAPLPPGETGEVWVRGPALMAGYLGRDHTVEDVLLDG
ncbi:class I adenylate-forming enzyme family protein [Streptomyces sp. NPDC101150]|uniref:class I adenylate-forming enzyme family protein n=1 Tax=Streptomyces sp. NPDC101150 TaxID=3366114 RepID=UPI00382AC0A3